MTVTSPAMTMQVREHDKVMEAYTCGMKSPDALKDGWCTCPGVSGGGGAELAEVDPCEDGKRDRR
jgi:hypothetical protein